MDILSAREGSRQQFRALPNVGPEFCRGSGLERIELACRRREQFCRAECIENTLSGEAHDEVVDGRVVRDTARVFDEFFCSIFSENVGDGAPRLESRLDKLVCLKIILVCRRNAFGMKEEVDPVPFGKCQSGLVHDVPNSLRKVYANDGVVFEDDRGFFYRFPNVDVRAGATKLPDCAASGELRMESNVVPFQRRSQRLFVETVHCRHLPSFQLASVFNSHWIAIEDDDYDRNPSVGRFLWSLDDQDVRFGHNIVE